MPTVSPDSIAAPLPPSPYLARGVVDQGDDGEPSQFAKLLGEQNAGTPADAADSASSTADSSQYSTTTQPQAPATAAPQNPARPSGSNNAAKAPVGGRSAGAKQSPTGKAAATAPFDPAVLTVTAAEAADASAVTDSALPVISAAGSGAPKDDVAGTVAPNGTGRVSRGRTSNAQAADDQSSIGQILNSSQQSNAQAANVPMPSGQILTGQMPTGPAPTGPAPTGQASTGQPVGGEASGGPPAIGEVSAGADLESLIPMASASIGQQPDGQGSNPTGTQAGAPVVAAPINLPAANADNASSSNSGSGAIAAPGAAAVTIPAGRTLPVSAGTTGSMIAADPGDQIPVAGTAVRAQAPAGSAGAGDDGAKAVQNSPTTQRGIAFSKDLATAAAQSVAASTALSAASAVSAEPDDDAGSGGASGAGDVAKTATPSPSFLSALHWARDPAGADLASADRTGAVAATLFAAGVTGETADAGQQDLAVPANAALAAVVPTAASLTPSIATPARDATGASDASGPSAAASDPNAAGAAVPVANIGVTIAAQAHAGNTRFEIRLAPPDLGRVDVQLSVDNSGTVSSRLIVERPETLDLLRRDAPQLERTLRDAGLDTGGGLQFALADQGFANRNWYVPHNDYSAAMPSGSSAEDTSAGNAGYAASSGRGIGLDITV